ncbi:hypothetical protein X474_06875 [Dethiosulfatarculus sandiegensis]|uniref:Uncharacterized protein n=1 Tax=Dethiosulfatarculus sandiegensis TaxID=1429043 RepID=A0A0D2HWW5_9BACT|nr:hypothetical protein X474_06875 [Dethiosulfatarculus sandiegensis]
MNTKDHAAPECIITAQVKNSGHGPALSCLAQVGGKHPFENLTPNNMTIPKQGPEVKAVPGK